MGKKNKTSTIKPIDPEDFELVNDVFIPITQQYPKKDYPKGLLMDVVKKNSIDLDIDIHNAREAAEVHRQVRKWVKTWIKPGMKLIDISNKLENASRNIIGENGLERGIAFPTGLSINNCAAHWTPNPGESSILKVDDVCKIDFGLHVNGMIIDSAFTHTFNDKYDKLLEASKEATMMGIKMAGPDVILGELGGYIQEVMESYEVELDGKIHPVKSIGQLFGHSIQRYKIHGGKSVPNIKMDYNYRMENGEFYAIETFASTGSGKIIEGSDVSHYMFNYLGQSVLKDGRIVYGVPPEMPTGKDKVLYDTINTKFSTLAFCKRWLSNLKIDKYQINLKNLVNLNLVKEYPPLYDIKGSYVAQFEHTLVLNNDKKEILSKGDDY